MSEGRFAHTATMLPDGRVLVAGGDDNSSSVLSAAETWDPATGAFSAADSLEVARAGHAAALLPDGRVLIVGGYGAIETIDGDEDRPVIAEAEIWGGPPTSGASASPEA
jgi:hypothetical protein